MFSHNVYYLDKSFLIIKLIRLYIKLKRKILIYKNKLKAKRRVIISRGEWRMVDKK
jgi:hypothetical protein